MSKYKAVIFDLDNTLFDSTTWFVNFTKEFLKNTPYNDWNYRNFYNELNTPTGTSEKIDVGISSAYWAGVKEASDYKLFPEDEDAIRQLHEGGIRMGICSRSTKTKIEQLLKDFEMDNLFEVIVDRAQKPDPKYLLIAIEQLGLTPKDVLYVGDEEEDVETGKNAGTDTAYILRSHEHFQETYKLQKDKIEELNPTYKITNLLELVSIIKG